MGKMGSWVPRQQSRDDKIQRVSVAGSLLARYRQAVAQRRPFFNQTVTGDEKWCLYVNMKQRKEWLSPGKDPTPRAKPNCINERLCCPSGGIVRVLYISNCFQRTRLSPPQFMWNNYGVWRVQFSRKGKKSNMPSCCSTTMPDRTAIITKTAIQELRWEVLPHPGYSPDLAPSDYHLLRSLAVNLRGVSFNNDEDFQKWLSDFFLQ
ncbi:LOW QUALITY PROTEIN: hypothetical protein M514_12452 [Trichuris suis]|uniref:Tc1-like transposase DDE domain-containing protein n=1 Tax=Trichuris suis TaxID=68888 RepID=A0A085ND51_9BILA|nr:LOW QUALITY PROTEIN: hypothetical protein M513_12452 [Trichuris suis]KFD67397.1 LOW QUALITY PROTEIN: hypothetical protein M514_12452 [Trichuris suis]